MGRLGRFPGRLRRALAPGLLVLLCAATSIAGPTTLSGFVNPMHLAAGEYVAVADIAVGAGTLTMEPGVTIRFTPGFGLSVGANGKIEGAGTNTSGILLTSNAGTPAPGDWKGIRVDAGGTARLEYCTVEFGGSDPVLGQVGVNPAGSLRMLNCTIRKSASSGIVLRGASGAGKTRVDIRACMIADNDTRSANLDEGAVQIIGSGSPVPMSVTLSGTVARSGPAGNRHPAVNLTGALNPEVRITGNAFRESREGIFGSLDSLARVSVGGNTYADNGYHNGIVINGGRLMVSGTLWRDGVGPGDGTYRLKAGATLAAGVTLWIVPGVELRFSADTLLYLDPGSPGARLVATGTGDSTGEIVLTSTPTGMGGSVKGPGGWHQVYFGPGASGLLEYARLEYGGGINQMIWLDCGSALSMRHCLLQQTARKVLLQQQPCATPPDLVMEHCILQNNEQAAGQPADEPALDLWGTAAIRSCTLTGTGTSTVRRPAVKVSGTVPADKVLLEGNTYRDNSAGVYLSGSGAATLTNNTFMAHTEAAIRSGLNGIVRSVFGVPSPNTYTVTPTGFGGVAIEAGDLTVGDGTLAAVEGRPYLVRPNSTARVGPGRTLEIPAGVHVLMSPGSTFNVQGRLLVRGAVGSEVLFTSASKSPAPGDWGCLDVEAGGSATFFHAVITHGGSAGRGMVLVDAGSSIGGNLFMASCTMWESSSSGVAARGHLGSRKAILQLHDCEIGFNNRKGGGDAGVALVGDYNWGQGPVSATIMHCAIHDNGVSSNGSGLYLSGPTSNILASEVRITGNVFYANGMGINNYGQSGATITCNRFSGSGEGIHDNGAMGAGTIMTSNEFGDANGSSFTWNVNANAPLDAPRNWWGINSQNRTQLKVTGSVSVSPILESVLPGIDAASVSVSPLGPTGVVSGEPVNVSFAFDRIMDPATVVVQILRSDGATVTNNIAPVGTGGRTWGGQVLGTISNGYYTVKVAAKAASCCGSLAEDALTVTPFIVYLGEPPDPPAGLQGGSPDGVHVALTWEASPSQVPGESYVYRIRRTMPGGGLGVVWEGDGLAFTDTPQNAPGLLEHLDYTLVVVDPAGRESTPLQFGIELDLQPPQVLVAEQPAPVVVNGVSYVTRDTVIAVAATDRSGVASLQYNVGGGSMKGLPAGGGNVDLSAVPDGACVLTVTAMDNLGNVSPGTTRNYVMDNTPPAAAVDTSNIFISGVTRYIALGSPVVINAPDAGSGPASITVNGITQPVPPGSSSASFGSLSGSVGTRSLAVSALDRVGNKATLPDYYVEVIAGLPVSTLVTAPGASYQTGSVTYMRRDTRFTLSAVCAIPQAGAIASLRYRIQGGGYDSGEIVVPNASTTEFSVPKACPAGDFTITYYAVDRLQQSEPARTAGFHLVAGTPTAPGVQPAVPVYVSGQDRYADPPFLFTLPSTIDAVLASVANHGIRDISVTITGLGPPEVIGTDDSDYLGIIGAEAPNLRIMYMVKDLVGQVAVSPAYPINLTNTPPLLALSFSDPQRVHAGSGATCIAGGVSISIMSTDSSVQEVDYWFPGFSTVGASPTPQTPLDLPATGQTGGLPPDQMTTFQYQIRGLSDSARSEDLYVDIQGPLVTLMPDPAKVSGGYVAATATWTISYSDGGSGVAPYGGNPSSGPFAFSRKGQAGAFGPCAPTFSLGAPDGAVEVVARVHDRVENAGYSSSHSYVVDGTPPVTTLVPGPGVVTVNGANTAPSPWQFTIQATDGAGSGVKALSTVVTDNGTTITPTADGVCTIQGTTTHQIVFRSTDNVGNVEAQKMYMVSLVGSQPGRPENLAAAPASSSSIRLAWLAPPSSVTPPGSIQSYLVYTGPAGSEAKDLAATTPVLTVPAPGLNCTVEVGTGNSASFIVRTQDVLGQLSAVPEFVVTSSARVLPPAITSPPDSGAPTVYTSLNVVVSGRAEPGSEVWLQLAGESSSSYLGTVSAGDGSFAFPYQFDTSLGGISTPLTVKFTIQKAGQISGETSRQVRFNLPPATPTGLQVAEALDTRIRLRWNCSSETGVSYRIYRNGNQLPLATVSQPASGSYVYYWDLALTDGSTYTYRIQAVGQGGTMSGLSEPVSASCSAGEGWGP